MPLTVRTPSNISCRESIFCKCKKISTKSPKIIGPVLWDAFHTMAFNYPENPDSDTIDKCISFLQGLPVMLGCEICKKHASEYIDSQSSKLREIASSKESLFIFFWEFHNTVNGKLGKKQMSLDEALSLYSHKYICGWNYLVFFCLILVILLVSYFLLKK